MPAVPSRPCGELLRNRRLQLDMLYMTMLRTPLILIATLFLVVVSVYAKNADAQTTVEKSSGWASFRGDTQSSGTAKASPSSASFTSLKKQWQFELADGGFESSAAIVDGTVYIAGITNDVKGKLFALKIADGSKRWEFDSPDGFGTTPLYHDGHLFLGDMLGVFRCISDQGAEVWQFKTEVEINSSANRYHDTILFGSQDAKLYCLSKDKGDVLWKHEIDDQIQSSITLSGDRVFLAGCDSRLHVINAANGQGQGMIEIQSPTIATPAVLGDCVFFGTEKADFFAIDSKAIELKWKRPDPKGGTSIRSSAAVTQGHVVFGGRNRKLVSLNPANGEENWSVTLKNKIDSSPIIVGDRVIAASTDGRLYIIDLDSGKELWQKQFNGSFIGSPAFAEDRVIIATDQGVVYCLSLQQ